MFEIDASIYYMHKTGFVPYGVPMPCMAGDEAGISVVEWWKLCTPVAL